MTDSNNKRPMFELPKNQQRRPEMRMPTQHETVDEMPEGIENAMESMHLHQQNNNTAPTPVEAPEHPVEFQNFNQNTSENIENIQNENSYIQQPRHSQPVIENRSLGNKTAQEIIAQLKKKQQFEEVILPSRNMLYEKYGLEIDKPIHVRPMTIEEEKIISTPRMIRSGQAIDRIFDACIYENIPVGKLLTADRTFLLFYIRGISYGPDYEVDIKCPSCDTQFTEEINLDTLPIEMCSDDFEGEISCILPDSQLAIKYKVPNGEDERALSRHRDMMIRGGFRSDAPDDTLVRRNIMLITNIEGITNKIEIEQIVNNIGVKDSNFIREKINNPGFGIITDISMRCNYCYHEWELDLPIDANFFFPRTKRAS